MQSLDVTVLDGKAPLVELWGPEDLAEQNSTILRDAIPLVANRLGEKLDTVVNELAATTIRPTLNNGYGFEIRVGGSFTYQAAAAQNPDELPSRGLATSIWQYSKFSEIEGIVTANNQAISEHESKISRYESDIAQAQTRNQDIAEKLRTSMTRPQRETLEGERESNRSKIDSWEGKQKKLRGEIDSLEKRSEAQLHYARLILCATESGGTVQAPEVFSNLRSEVQEVNKTEKTTWYKDGPRMLSYAGTALVGVAAVALLATGASNLVKRIADAVRVDNIGKWHEKYVNDPDLKQVFVSGHEPKSDLILQVTKEVESREPQGGVMMDKAIGTIYVQSASISAKHMTKYHGWASEGITNVFDLFGITAPSHSFNMIDYSQNEFLAGAQASQENMVLNVAHSITREAMQPYRVGERSEQVRVSKDQPYFLLSHQGANVSLISLGETPAGAYLNSAFYALDRAMQASFEYHAEKRSRESFSPDSLIQQGVQGFRLDSWKEMYDRAANPLWGEIARHLLTEKQDELGITQGHIDNYANKLANSGFMRNQIAAIRENPDNARMQQYWRNQISQRGAKSVAESFFRDPVQESINAERYRNSASAQNRAQ